MASPPSSPSYGSHIEVDLVMLLKSQQLSSSSSDYESPDYDTSTASLSSSISEYVFENDMANKYPMAEVIGTDLSPIQSGWVPPNCRFEVDDVEKDWTFRSDLLDFFHMRNLAQAVTDWPKLIPEAYRCTAPGGYVELVEVGQIAYSDDGSMKADNAVKRNFEPTTKAMAMIRRPAEECKTMREEFEKAGFVDVKVAKVKQPIGPWPKDKQ
ncbi:hypothetical protein BDD12DRAFT_910426 [Trichophaea hybrida]|nr:hypothetical protein BDD12DRAFT_910426 [Trichophaea hybrida]